MNIFTALEKFITQLEANELSHYTIGQYRRHVKRLAHWCREIGHSTQISDISHEHLSKFLISPSARKRADGREKKASSMNALRSSIRNFFGYCHKAGFIPVNPSRLVRHARCGRSVPRTLSKSEIDRLMDQMLQDTSPEARRDHALFHLLATTGIRIGSTLAIEVEDVDLDQGEIRLRTAKGNREERVFLSNKIRQHLSSFIGDRCRGALFLSRQDRRISSRHVSRRFEMWLRIAGIPNNYTIHSLRHSFATDLYQRTGDIHLVQRALHHRSIVSTLVYTRIVEDGLRQVMQA